MTKARSKLDRIMIIGGTGLAPKAMSLGVRVIHVQRSEDFSPPESKHADLTVVMDYEDADAVARVAKALYELYPFMAAVTVEEDAVLATAEVNHSLNLPGVGRDTVRLLVDKWAMRQLLNREGLGFVGASIGADCADLERFASAYDYPFVVKPIAASCGYGAFRVDHAASLRDAWTILRDLGTEVFLMEEYLDGPEVSVEFFSFHGNHVMLAITDQMELSGLLQTGHSLPTRLPPGEQRRIQDFVSAFLDCVGLSEGASHTEIKLTSDGPKIIESHNRRAGGRIHEMMRLVYGIDIETISLGWAAGAIEPLKSSPRASGGAAIRYLSATPGVVRDIHGIEDLRGRDDVAELKINVRTGDMIPPLRHSLDRAGHVLVCRSTAGEAVSAARDYASRITFDIERISAVAAPDRDASLIRKLDRSRRLGYTAFSAASSRSAGPS